MKSARVLVPAGLVVIGLLIQLIPYGRDHANPPVKTEAPWDRPATRTLARQACFDCHSNQTVWPWYSNIAPASWLVYHDVMEGRKHINFSDWTRSEPQHVDEFQKVYEENSMPPANYLLLHPGARLPEGERQQLFDGLAVMAASYQP
jgi:hypothetical protein